MRLRIVGSAGSVAGPENPPSCYLVEADAAGRTWRLVLDLGAGSIGPLQRYCDPARVDAVLITHGHPDHCADLGALSVLRRYGPTKDEGLPRIPLLGPRGIDVRVGEIGGSNDGHDISAFDFTSLDQGARIQLGPFDIIVARAWHPMAALAYRIEGPGESGSPGAPSSRASLVFTGDTDRNDEVLELARGADTLLVEAGWAHREINSPGIHLNASQAAQLAADAGAGRVLLTHIASWVDPALSLAQAQEIRPDAVLALPGALHVV